MNIQDATIVEYRLIREIVRNYNTLDYTSQLKALLSPIFPKHHFDNWCKLDFHKKINELIFKEYEGEQVLKYRLFRAFHNLPVVAAYEIKVKNSRVDFLTIEEHTTSYEIKSTLDNLYKLSKQSDDYLKAFEFNNILIHERHLDKCLTIVPSNFGIITVDKAAHSVVRKPVLNKYLDPYTQLSILTKKELNKAFASTDLQNILTNFDAQKINRIFKSTLKSRYQERWDFIVKHSNDILPIDIQFFFNKNIKPAHIYS